VDFPHDVTDQFNGLTDALEDPGTDLQTVLAVLVDDLRAAIPSVLGLTATITQAGDAVTLTSAEPDVPAAAAASLHVPLDEVTAAGSGSTVTFYAARWGAFVDLAADIRYAYGLDGQVVIDGHLDDYVSAAGTPGVTGLAELLVINRAIGVLIGQGHQGNARSVLQRRADQAGISLGAAAQHILDELTPGTQGLSPVRQ
jgi:hypothetical protein